MYAYVGSRTTRERHARGEGLSVFRVDPASGSLSRIQVLGDLVNPSYLTLDREGTHLYAVHGDQTSVSAFHVDRATGRLSALNTRSTEGRNPVHLALSPDGAHLVVTNHLGATVVVLPVRADGSLGAVSQSVPFDGPLGPHRVEQQQAKPHFNLFDPSGRFVVVPDKGLDRVFSFHFDGGRLRPCDPPFMPAREGAGPRSVVFHPRRPLACVVNELDSTITSCGVDPVTGALQPRQILSTLPASFTGNSRAAGITIDAHGHTVYASNRGHDSIAVFRVDAGSGLLHFVSTLPSGGRTPRFFTLSPQGRWLYALNEDSDTIHRLAVGDDGMLEPDGLAAACGSPVCMIFSSPSTC